MDQPIDFVIDAITADKRFNWDHFDEWAKTNDGTVLDYFEELIGI